MSNLVPYRQNAKLQTISGKTYGLAVAPKPAHTHICNPPCYIFRLWYWIIGHPIHDNSLWRCGCGMFWILIYNWYRVDMSDKFERARTLRRWQEMGMSLLPEDSKRDWDSYDIDEDEDEEDDGV